VRSFFAGDGPQPGRPELEQAFGAVDGIVALAREKPDAVHEGRTLRQLVGDTTEDLEGTNCAASLVDRLRQGLASIPAS
jgi:hypothetical protein